jgi:hypothetical protein
MEKVKRSRMKTKNRKSLFGIGKLVAIIFVVAIIIMAAIAGFTWYYYNPTTTTTSTTTNSTPFSISVTTRPKQPAGVEKGMLGMVGQKCIFLVSIADQTGGNLGSVQISASNEEEMADVQVNPTRISAGQIAEVIVVPKMESIGKNLTIAIAGERSGLIQKETTTVEVIDWEDTIGPTAAEMRDKFIPWLAANYPEIGITSETEWEGTMVNPRILVVMHYIFLSEEWEVYVTWHVMIPPSDWVKVYLRNRFNETSSSYAFEISSVEEGGEPHPIELPDWI